MTRLTASDAIATARHRVALDWMLTQSGSRLHITYPDGPPHPAFHAVLLAAVASAARTIGGFCNDASAKSRMAGRSRRSNASIVAAVTAAKQNTSGCGQLTYQTMGFPRTMSGGHQRPRADGAERATNSTKPQS